MSKDTDSARGQRLRRLAVQAERRLRERQRQWHEAREGLRTLERQRETLDRFAKEYHASDDARAATTPLMLASRQRFLQSLRAQLDALDVRVGRQRASVSMLRERLRRPAGESLALDLLAERIEHACRIASERRDQRRMDDAAGSRAIRRADEG